MAEIPLRPLAPKSLNIPNALGKEHSSCFFQAIKSNSIFQSHLECSSAISPAPLSSVRGQLNIVGDAAANRAKSAIQYIFRGQSSQQKQHQQKQQQQQQQQQQRQQQEQEQQQQEQQQYQQQQQQQQQQEEGEKQQQLQQKKQQEGQQEQKEEERQGQQPKQQHEGSVNNMDPKKWAKALLKAFPSFRFYFDLVDDQTRENSSKQIRRLGGKIEPFFSNACTHIITTRPFVQPQNLIKPQPQVNGEQVSSAVVHDKENINISTSDIRIPANSHLALYSFNTAPKGPLIQKPANPTGENQTIREPTIETKIKNASLIDKAFSLKMKVWSLERFHARILKPLLHYASFADMSTERQQPELTQLLREEKVYGPITSYGNPFMPRPDFHYFKNSHYLLVEDTTGIYRPIYIREYTRHPIQLWPKLQKNRPGKCPFIRSPPRANMKENEQIKKPQEVLGSVNAIPQTQVTKNDDIVYSTSNVSASSCKNGTVTFWNDSRGKPRALANIESTASGMIKSVTSQAVSIHSGTTPNGDPPRYPYQVKLLETLDRRATTILADKIRPNKGGVELRKFQEQEVHKSQEIPESRGRKRKAAEANLLTKDAKNKMRKPGFCENCHVKFDNLDDHIIDRNHRQFATNLDNYKELDILLAMLQRPLLASCPTVNQQNFDIHISASNDIADIEDPVSGEDEEYEQEELQNIRSTYSLRSSVRRKFCSSDGDVISCKGRGWECYADVFNAN